MCGCPAHCRKALRLVGDTQGVHPIKANLAILLMHLDSAQEAVQLLEECLAGEGDGLW